MKIDHSFIAVSFRGIPVPIPILDAITFSPFIEFPVSLVNYLPLFQIPEMARQVEGPRQVVSRFIIVINFRLTVVRQCPKKRFVSLAGRRKIR